MLRRAPRSLTTNDRPVFSPVNISVTLRGRRLSVGTAGLLSNPEWVSSIFLRVSNCAPRIAHEVDTDAAISSRNLRLRTGCTVNVPRRTVASYNFVGSQWAKRCKGRVGRRTLRKESPSSHGVQDKSASGLEVSSTVRSIWDKVVFFPYHCASFQSTATKAPGMMPARCRF
jgi:hypothetical protein